MRNEERGKASKKFEDSELQALLDEDDAQTQQQLADQLSYEKSSLYVWNPWKRSRRENGFHMN